MKDNYYIKIKEEIIKSEIYDRVKDYQKDRNKVITYFEIGRLLSIAGKEYGKNIIKQYSNKLMNEIGKKYNERNLRYMRHFYEIFSKENWNPMGSNLSWSHYRELLCIKNSNAIKYYIKICEENNLTKRQLQERIKSKEYERLPNNSKESFSLTEKSKIQDLVPNPIIIKNTFLSEEISEYALKQLILSNLDVFLMQLGQGYSYIANEYRIKVDDKYNYIDLLLFNIKYNCYVIIELKVVPLKKEHIGQIQVYMNYIDKNIKSINQENTIGIIICKRNNDYVIEYSSDSRIITREFILS